MTTKETKTISNEKNESAKELPLSLAKRIMCILAHVDHGKTTIADCLLAMAGVVRHSAVGKVRFMDTREDEQLKGITMKTAAFSMKYNVSETNYVITVVDTPGHVDFSKEVLSAVKSCDGALIVVDIVEGVRAQTREAIQIALEQGLKLILVINKFDRLVLDLKKDILEVYNYIRRLIESCNSVVSQVCQLNDMEEEDNLFCVDRDNVIIGSGIDGWGVLPKNVVKIFFAHDKTDPPEIIERKQMQLEIVIKNLNDPDCYMSADRSVKRGAIRKYKGCLFLNLVVRPIYDIYYKLGVRTQKEPELVAKICGVLDIPIPKEMLFGPPRAQISAALRTFAALGDTIVRATVDFMPDSKIVPTTRIHRLIQGKQYDEDDGNKTLMSNMLLRLEISNLPEHLKEPDLIDQYKCAEYPDEPCFAYVSKIISVPRSQILSDPKMRENQLAPRRYRRSINVPPPPEAAAENAEIKPDVPPPPSADAQKDSNESVSLADRTHKSEFGELPASNVEETWSEYGCSEQVLVIVATAMDRAKTAALKAAQLERGVSAAALTPAEIDRANIAALRAAQIARANIDAHLPVQVIHIRDDADDDSSSGSLSLDIIDSDEEDLDREYLARAQNAQQSNKADTQSVSQIDELVSAMEISPEKKLTVHETANKLEDTKVEIHENIPPVVEAVEHVSAMEISPEKIQHVQTVNVASGYQEDDPITKLYDPTLPFVELGSETAEILHAMEVSPPKNQNTQSVHEIVDNQDQAMIRDRDLAGANIPIVPLAADPNEIISGIERMPQQIQNQLSPLLAGFNIEGCGIIGGLDDARNVYILNVLKETLKTNNESQTSPPKITNAVTQTEEDVFIDDTVADKLVTIAVIRLFYGTIKKGDDLVLLQSGYKPPLDERDQVRHAEYNRDRMLKFKVKQLYILNGREVIQASEASAGVICGVDFDCIPPVKGELPRSGTIVNSELFYPVYEAPQLDPVLRVSVMPVRAKNMVELGNALKWLTQCDSVVKVTTDENGEYVFLSSGDVHLSKITLDLKNYLNDIPLIFSDPIVKIRETVLNPISVDNETCIAALEKTTYTMSLHQYNFYIEVHVSALPASVAKLIEENRDLLLQVEGSEDWGYMRMRTVQDNGTPMFKSFKKRLPSVQMRNQVLKFEQKLMSVMEREIEEFRMLEPRDSRYMSFRSADIWRYIWTINDYAQTECSNVLLNSVYGYKRNIFSTIDQIDQRSLVDSCIVSAFRETVRSGPICGEPVTRCVFTVKDFNIGTYDFIMNCGINISTITTHITNACVLVMKQAMLKQTVRLMEPIMETEIVIASAAQTGMVNNIIEKRNGKVVNDSIMNVDETRYGIIASIPAINCAGFANEIRQATSGFADAFLTYSGYALVPGDPINKLLKRKEGEEDEEEKRENNRAYTLRNTVRKRKGLDVDEEVVACAEKQRTLSRKK